MSDSLLATARAFIARLRGRAVPERCAPVEVALPEVDRAAVERLVGQPVGDVALYRQALLHRSLLRGQADSYRYSNERLEFLGDAVLGYVVAEVLYREFPDEDEGFLTRMRAKIVNGQALARHAQDVGLGPMILMSENMANTQGRENPTILADAFEAVVGAIYLDQGEDAARSFIEGRVLAGIDLRHLAERRDNYKSLLLEHAQAHGWPQPRYRVTSEEGPSHDKVFTVEVVVRGKVRGAGRAGSKKRAEQKAAHEALDALWKAEGKEG